jgi:hypothetical protein
MIVKGQKILLAGTRKLSQTLPKELFISDFDHFTLRNEDGSDKIFRRSRKTRPKPFPVRGVQTTGIAKKN